MKLCNDLKAVKPELRAKEMTPCRSFTVCTALVKLYTYTYAPIGSAYIIDAPVNTR